MKKELAILMTSPFLAFMLIGSSIVTAQPSPQNGTISSIQNGPDGKPTWKVSGTWNIAYPKSKSFETFNASFNMMKFDGSSAHKHNIPATLTSADFKLN